MRSYDSEVPASQKMACIENVFTECNIKSGSHEYSSLHICSYALNDFVAKGISVTSCVVPISAQQ